MASPLFPDHFYFQQKELREKEERAKGKKGGKKKKKGGGILGTKCTSDSVPHAAKMKQDPIGSF